MAKELKTNAMRFLDKNKIDYTVQTYECDEFIDGIHTAETLGQPLSETLRSLPLLGEEELRKLFPGLGGPLYYFFLHFCPS